MLIASTCAGVWWPRFSSAKPMSATSGTPTTSTWPKTRVSRDERSHRHDGHNQITTAGRPHGF